MVKKLLRKAVLNSPVIGTAAAAADLVGLGSISPAYMLREELKKKKKKKKKTTGMKAGGKVSKCGIGGYYRAK